MTIETQEFHVSDFAGLHQVVARYRQEKKWIFRDGVNAATLFPDLDGLSAFVNWTIETREYWKIFQDASAF